MAKAKTRKRTKEVCTQCGDSTPGGGVCVPCLSKATTQLDKADTRRVAERVRERLAGGGKDLSGPVCPHCRASLDWNNIAFIETEVSIYVREKIYYCPACRAFLGASSWHTEG